MEQTRWMDEVTDIQDMGAKYPKAETRSELEKILWKNNSKE